MKPLPLRTNSLQDNVHSAYPHHFLPTDWDCRENTISDLWQRHTCKLLIGLLLALLFRSWFTIIHITGVCCSHFLCNKRKRRGEKSHSSFIPICNHRLSLYLSFLVCLVTIVLSESYRSRNVYFFFFNFSAYSKYFVHITIESFNENVTSARIEQSDKLDRAFRNFSCSRTNGTVEGRYNDKIQSKKWTID